MAYETQYMARSSVTSNSTSVSEESVATDTGTPVSGTQLDFSEESKVSATAEQSPNRLIVSAEKRKRKHINCLDNLKEVCLQIGSDMKSRISSRESKDESKRLKEQRKLMEAELRKVEKEKELELVRAKRVKGEIVALWLQQGRNLSDLPADLI